MEEEQVQVNSYLWQSIVVTILCCLPLGIPAIIFAAKVNGYVAEGKIAEAQDASAKAKMWCWIAFGLGIVAIIASVAIQVLGFAALGAAGSY